MTVGHPSCERGSNAAEGHLKSETEERQGRYFDMFPVEQFASFVLSKFNEACSW